MKNFIDKLSFLFKLSFKNIFSSKLRAFVLFFSSIIIVVLLFLIFSLNSFLSGFFIANFNEQKGNSDIYISIDDNYGSRYFSIRNLEESLDENYYSLTVSYFKIASLSYIGEDYSYVNIIMSNLNDFKKTGNFTEYPFNLLGSNEIIITKSFANEKKLEVEDAIFLQMGSEKLSFKVVAIVKDGGLVRGSTVFIDKDSNIKNIITAIYPNLATLNPIFFNKLCNGAYVYLNNNIDNSEVITALNSIEEYKGLHIEESINIEEINVLVNRNIAYFSVGIVLVLISILFVVQSSLTIIFNDRLKQLGIMKTLGGREKDFLITLIFEVLFYLILAIIFGPILCLLIMKVGLNFIGSNYVFTIKFFNLLYTFISLLILYGFIVLISYLKVKKLAINKIIKTSKYKNTNWFYLSLLFIGIIIIYILNNLFLTAKELLKYRGIINYVLIIIIGIILVKILIGLAAIIFKKNTLFRIIFVDDANRNKITKSIIIVLLVAFTSIVIFVGLTRSDERKITTLYEETKVDLVVTNIIKEDDLNIFLNNNNKVDDFEKGILYNNVLMNNEKYFSQMISVSNFDNYFDFGLEHTVIDKLNSSENALVLIPIKYKYLYNYNVGDVIILSFNELYNSEPFTIVEFFDSNYEDLILTNFYLLDDYKTVNYNSFFINSNNKTLLKNELINNYSENLYYIIDFDELINEIEIYSRNLRQFISFLSLFFILCFVFTILNNSILLFEINKNSFARLKIIGTSKKRLAKNIIYQYLLIAFVCAVSSFLVIFVIMSNLKYILLFFNVYQEINLFLSDYIIGYVISVIVFFISYLYYIRLAINLKVNVVIKELD